MNVKRCGLLILTFAVMATAVGCGVSLPFVDPRLTDGGGGDVISGSLKVIQGNMTALSQDEVQQLSDQINAIIKATKPGFNPPPLTNAQADAFIAFLKANRVPGGTMSGLNTFEDMQNFAAAAIADPSIIILPPGFEEAFGEFESIEDVFGPVFGDI